MAFIDVLSVTAIITTVALFFTGIPICIDIYRRGSTDDISSFPFVIGFVSSTFWLRYGFLTEQTPMIVVNAIGGLCMFCYLLFYIAYSRSRYGICAQFAADLLVILVMLLVVQLKGEAVRDTLGLLCLIFNVICFGAPLAGVVVVIKRKSSATLPLSLCAANLLVAMQWMLYGFLLQDFYIIIPNGLGVLLSMAQLSLFFVYPVEEYKFLMRIVDALRNKMHKERRENVRRRRTRHDITDVYRIAEEGVEPRQVTPYSTTSRCSAFDTGDRSWDTGKALTSVSTYSTSSSSSTTTRTLFTSTTTISKRRNRTRSSTWDEDS